MKINKTKLKLKHLGSDEVYELQIPSELNEEEFLSIAKKFNLILRNLGYKI